MSNDKATQHYLTPTDQMFFISKINEIKERVQRICNEQELKGYFELSADFKWLVKTGE